MYKKSITRIDNENESSQADLSSPAMHDIIATNHVVLAKVSTFSYRCCFYFKIFFSTKKSRGFRLSRACKALIVMIILALVAIGIIILTLVLARKLSNIFVNFFMTWVSVLEERSFNLTSNESDYISDVGLEYLDSRNTLMAIIARSAEENALPTTNNSRFLSINHESQSIEISL